MCIVELDLKLCMNLKHLSVDAEKACINKSGS